MLPWLLALGLATVPPAPPPDTGRALAVHAEVHLIPGLGVGVEAHQGRGFAGLGVGHFVLGAGAYVALGATLGPHLAALLRLHRAKVANIFGGEAEEAAALEVAVRLGWRRLAAEVGALAVPQPDNRVVWGVNPGVRLRLWP